MNQEHLIRQALSTVPKPACEMTPTRVAGISLMLNTVATIHQWAADPLGGNETAADRLRALLLGAAGIDHGNPLTKDERLAIDVARSVLFEFLLKRGIYDDDATAIRDHFDRGCCQAAWHFLGVTLPSGDAALAEIDAELCRVVNTSFEVARYQWPDKPVRITLAQREAIERATQLAAKVIARRAGEITRRRERMRARG